ncbi:MAG: hypothetical protein GVY19_08955 [Bacteroidetes bacterium]|jgi:diaminohydroxyphosphoribosylaminopyrimidine deaminase/5-amino-6-(5-phosphoribosylamino)uracil reductase|nr:hypothetical protein [Bacteroidota bacterium]
METLTQKCISTWNVLLQIKEFSSGIKDFEFLCVPYHDESGNIEADSLNLLHSHNDRIIVSKSDMNGLKGNYVLVVINELCIIQHTYNGFLDDDSMSLLTNYLPYSLISWWAKKQQSTYAISHFAQSLDGKIATYTGESKWIGGDENLVHAHRMRALCDAILIGGNTLQRDHPKLTVRHVDGNNPIKIVVGNSDYPFESVLSSQDKTVFFTTHNGIDKKGLDVVICENKNGFIHPDEILKQLYALNIYSVYIEGGAYTTSQFLLNHALNEIQLYLAPSIMGSGIANFTLPAIGGIDEAIRFTHHRFFNMGTGIMFAGRLNIS